MDLIKLIDQNVECVATPNGKYLNRSQVFEVVEKFTSTNNAMVPCQHIWATFLAHPPIEQCTQCDAIRRAQHQ